MKEKPEKCQLSLTMKEKPEKCQLSLTMKEMPISRQTSSECAIIACHEWKAGESLTMKEKPEKCQFRPFLWQKDDLSVVSNKEFFVATTCTAELVSG